MRDLQVRGVKGGRDEAGAWVLEGSAKKTIGVVIAKVKEAIPACVCPWLRDIPGTVCIRRAQIVERGGPVIVVGGGSTPQLCAGANPANTGE